MLGFVFCCCRCFLDGKWRHKIRVPSWLKVKNKWLIILTKLEGEAMQICHLTWGKIPQFQYWQKLCFLFIICKILVSSEDIWVLRRITNVCYIDTVFRDRKTVTWSGCTINTVHTDLRSPKDDLTLCGKLPILKVFELRKKR